ncbi:NADP-dependent oxidoreductase [Chitinimonas sp. BJB300]|uniref:NADP-dependent oxidoreductase n=1 Tax=Chitinimonas sp. BJB300 TaxID=1559339 RepID=UPI000C114C38|nr:NADP-dependent oxidoreductase [Chitinimonas sp. BJB300]PHV11561.1 NADP-dependent oxidoreductase [Chitinimonas sp. BJB300]TSJ88981.1 NADP-dependent oxidoreductase [Chitinimonas sp. BJB300]
MQRESSAVVSSEIRLKSRPSGLPTLENFELVKVPVPAPKAGEVLVRNLWMSVDPYMRGRMNEGQSYIPPFELGRVLEGSAIGQIVTSNVPELQAGDYVTSMFGWREAYVAAATSVQRLDVTPSLQVPLESHLGALGVPGLTAYVALFRIANLKPGERVFISGATGAVGAAACAFAKAMGCYVVGTAGSEEKRAWTERVLGIDAAINYRAPDFDSAVARAFPDGIDVYLDNAGGEQLRVALDHMREFGRIACCGMIDQYNDTVPKSGPANLYNIVTRKLHMEGFIVMDHFDLTERFQRAAADLVRAGKLKWRHTIATGLAAAPQALIDLNSGKSFGKSLVRLSQMA